MRPREDYDALLKAADRFEVEMARRMRSLAKKRREQVHIAELALALEAKDVRRAMAIIGESKMLSDMDGVMEWLRDVRLYGGKLGAAAVNREVMKRRRAAGLRS